MGVRLTLSFSTLIQRLLLGEYGERVIKYDSHRQPHTHTAIHTTQVKK